MMNKTSYSNRLEDAIANYHKNEKSLHKSLKKNKHKINNNATTDLDRFKYKPKHRSSPYLPHQRRRQQQHQKKVITVIDDEGERNMIGLKPGQYQVDIPELNRKEPTPVQQPDGRRYRGDKEQYSEEWFENEARRRDLLIKNKDYNFMRLVSGFIGDTTVEELYVYRDTEVAETLRIERIRRRDIRDRARLVELEKILRELQPTTKIQQSLDDTAIRIAFLTKQSTQLFKNEDLARLPKIVDQIEAINRFFKFIVSDSEYIVALDSLKNNNNKAYDVNRLVEARRKAGLTLHKNYPQTQEFLEQIHTIDLFDALNEPLIADIVSPIFFESPGAGYRNTEIKKAGIEQFGKAFSFGVSAVPRAKLLAKLDKLKKDEVNLKRLDRERKRIQNELAWTIDHEHMLGEQLKLAFKRQQQLQEEITRILNRSAEFSEDPSIEWLDRPENSGKFELNDKVAAALNLAYTTVKSIFNLKGSDPSMNKFMNSELVRVQFANLVYLYYYLNGIPRRYLPAFERPSKEAGVKHILEFFRVYIDFSGYKFYRIQPDYTRIHPHTTVIHKTKYDSPLW